jgi:ornithine carbamoyltransferase
MDLKTYKKQAEFSQLHLLGLSGYTKDEIFQVLKLALDLKQKQKKGVAHKLLEGKVLAMIFAKSSTRTRVSFQSGIYQLGGTGLFLSSNDLQLGRGETLSDTAKTLSGMVDGIMIRTYKQSDVDALAVYGSIPVINGLTDLLHPCQALADIMTFYEKVKSFEGKKMCYVGDGNNVAHSLMMACAKVGLDISLGCPEDCMLDPKIIALASSEARKSGASISIYDEPKRAVNGADAVYTDVWASMGEEGKAEEKHKKLSAFQVNEDLMGFANSDAIFLHCLPAHRGEEVTKEIIDGEKSVVFEQAENRLHAQKAVMALLMGE